MIRKQCINIYKERWTPIIIHRVDNFRLQKLALKSFWSNFGKFGKPNKCNGCGVSNERKINLLKEYSKLKFYFKRGLSVNAKRDKFNNDKRNKRYWKRKCFVCGGSPVIRHHIILLQNGGYNQRRNVIALCEICHAEIHTWLKIATK